MIDLINLHKGWFPDKKIVRFSWDANAKLNVKGD